MASSAPPLPSGPLRFAASTSGPSKPHTFSLRYPASHPAGLSTTGAALTSAASGDVSLRIAQGVNSSEPRGRRWAGRQSRPTGDIECVVAWDEKQHCWTLHRLDNVVQLASDDPEPLPKKLALPSKKRDLSSTSSSQNPPSFSTQNPPSPLTPLTLPSPATTQAQPDSLQAHPNRMPPTRAPDHSLTVTTESTAGHGISARRFPLPSSNGVGGRQGVSSPIPTWQYSQHLQRPINGGSPLGINGNQSPAPLTNQNLSATLSAPLASHHSYQSDSGSSVRESDTDSDGEEDESSEDLEPVIPPPDPPIQQSHSTVEPLRDSEQDAEAEDDDEDSYLQDFASELEASVLIDNMFGSRVGLGPYGAAPPATQAKETNKGGRNKRKAVGSHTKATTGASSRKTSTSKAKANKVAK